MYFLYCLLRICDFVAFIYLFIFYVLWFVILLLEVSCHVRILRFHAPYVALLGYDVMKLAGARFLFISSVDV